MLHALHDQAIVRLATRNNRPSRVFKSLTTTNDRPILFFHLLLASKFSAFREEYLFWAFQQLSKKFEI